MNESMDCLGKMMMTMIGQKSGMFSSNNNILGEILHVYYFVLDTDINNIGWLVFTNACVVFTHPFSQPACRLQEEWTDRWTSRDGRVTRTTRRGGTVLPLGLFTYKVWDKIQEPSIPFGKDSSIRITH